MSATAISSLTSSISPAIEQQQSLSDTVIIVASVGAFLIIGSIIIIITLVTIFIRKPKRQISDDNSEYVNAVQPVGRQSQGQPLDQKKPTRQQDNQTRCEVVRTEEDRTKNKAKRRTKKDEHQQGLYAQVQKDPTVNDCRTRETEQTAAGGGGVVYAVLDFDNDFTENRDEAKKFINHGKETKEKEDAEMRGAEGTEHSIKKRSKKDKGRFGKEEKCHQDGREDPLEVIATNREDGHLVEEERSTTASPFNIGSDGYVKMKPPDAPRISEVSHSDSIYSLAKDPDLPNNVRDHDH